MKKLLAQLMRTFTFLFALGAAVPAFAQVTAFVTFDRSQGQLPESIAIDKSGNIYVSFVGAHSVAKVTPAGVVSTFAVLPPPKS